MGARGGEPGRRSPLVDLGSERVPAGLPGLGASLRDREDPAGDLRAERRALDGGSRMKLSVVMPARSEEDSVGETLERVVQALEAERIAYEVLVVDDHSTDGTAAVADRASVENPRVRCIRSPYDPGYGFAVRAGLDEYTGDAVAVMMADGSDHPEDLVRYHHELEEGWERVFGSRFIRGARLSSYPRVKLVINRLANWF